MRLTEAVKKFIDQALHVMPSTRRAYEDELRLFAGWALPQIGDTVLGFTAELVTEYLVLLSKRQPPLSMHVILRRRSVLAEFSRWGAGKRYWANDVLASVPRVRKPKTVPRPYLKADREKLMALPLTGVERTLRAVLYYSGVRVSEALSLRVRHFASEAKTLTIEKGKGDKSRTIGIPSQLVAVLEAWVLERTDLHPQSFLFLRSRALGKPMSRLWAGAACRRWGKQAGVVKVTPHRFRHTYATRLLERGVDLKKIQMLMGHESVATTAMYLGVVDRDLAEAVEHAFEEPVIHRPVLLESFDSGPSTAESGGVSAEE